jgi:hypothetical protein
MEQKVAKRRHYLQDAKIIARRKDGLNNAAIGGLRLSDLEFEIDPGVVAAINEDTDNLHRQVRNDNIRPGINASKVVHYRVTGIELTTDEAEVPHTIEQTPFSYFVVPKSAGVWYESREPDSRAVYLKASTGSMTVDVLIQG